MESDTIYYANGESATCASSAEWINQGEEIIFKTRRNRNFEHSIHFNEGKNLKTTIKPIVHYGICDVGILNLNKNGVKGNITKNYEDSRYCWERLVKKFSKKYYDKIS